MKRVAKPPYSRDRSGEAGQQSMSNFLITDFNIGHVSSKSSFLQKLCLDRDWQTGMEMDDAAKTGKHYDQQWREDELTSKPKQFSERKSTGCPVLMNDCIGRSLVQSHTEKWSGLNNEPTKGETSKAK